MQISKIIVKIIETIRKTIKNIKNKKIFFTQNFVENLKIIVKITMTIKNIKMQKTQKIQIYLEFHREFKNLGYYLTLLLNCS